LPHFPLGELLPERPKISARCRDARMRRPKPVQNFCEKMLQKGAAAERFTSDCRHSSMISKILG
jgi:hypothetical protein